MKRKNCIAILLSTLLATALVACGANFYANAGSIDGREIPSGIYLYYQYTAYNEALSEVGDSEVDLFKQEIDGQKATDWIANRTEELLRKFVCVERMCAEREIVMSEESKSYIDQMNSYWDMAAQRYENNGISYESVMHGMTNDMLADELFKALYAEDGEMAPSDAEMKQAYEEQYAHIRYIMVPFTASDETVDVKADVEAQAQAMLEELQSGTNIEAVAEDGMKKVYELVGREFTEDTVSGSISTSYIAYDIEGEDESYTPEFRETLRTLDVGDSGVYEMSNLLLVYEKIPTFEDDAEFEETRSNVVMNLYSEDFDAYLASIYDTYPVQWETGARWYLRPEKIEE